MIEFEINTIGTFVKIDDEDKEKINRFDWVLDGGYVVTRSRPRITMHSLITGFEGVDHIDGNATNNQKSNLRRATTKQNSQNRKTPSNNKTGYKGVHFTDGRYRAQIGCPHKHLGYFDTPEKAAMAYNKAATEMFGNFARLNVV